MSQITRTYTFNDGTTAYGSQVESEVANIANTWNLHDAGTNTWTAVKTTVLTAGDGSANTPSISFINSTNIGFYRVGVNIIGVATNSTLRWQFGSAGDFTSLSNNTIFTGDGTAGSPGYNFANSQNMGIYKVGTNVMGLSTNSVLRLQIGATGSVAVGVGAGALATNVTDGFLYIPTCAGTPTGVPTTITGLAPFIFDTTASKIWFYNGTWKAVAVA